MSKIVKEVLAANREYGKRRRNPIPRHLTQAPRDTGVVRRTPHQLRHGNVHRRDHGGPAGGKPGDLDARRKEVARHGESGGVRGRSDRELAHDPGPGRKRLRGRDADPVASPGTVRHPNLRICLRREVRPASGGPRSHPDRESLVRPGIPAKRTGPGRSPAARQLFSGPKSEKGRAGNVAHSGVSFRCGQYAAGQ